MADNRTEQALREAMCAHRGGVGPSLSEEDKKQIMNGILNNPENETPVDGKKFLKGFVSSLKRHPLEWLVR